MKKKFRALTLAAAVLASGLAFAQTGDVKPGAPELSLSAQARAEVENDLMTVVMSAEGQGPNVQALTQKVMATMQQATIKAKRIPGAEVRVGNVNTYPVWGPKGRTSNWNVRADLVLKSTNFAALGTLASELTADMQISNISFSLSPVKRESEENRLITEVSTAFKSKATALSQAMGFKGYSLKSMNYNHSTGGGGGARPMYMKAMAETADMAAVPVPSEGGKSEVSVNMTGTVELR